MKISNVRLGFATNSSSSHSIVVLPRGVSVLPACGANRADGHGYRGRFWYRANY